MELYLYSFIAYGRRVRELRLVEGSKVLLIKKITYREWSDLQKKGDPVDVDDKSEVVILIDMDR